MGLYKEWLKESKYLIIKTEFGKIISVKKTNSVKYYLGETGYFGIYDSITCLHEFYINHRKCKFMNQFLKIAYEFDYCGFVHRCRKDKLRNIDKLNS